MTFNLEEAREAFEQFLMLMDGQIEWLVAQAQTHGIELDGSPESLDRLERLHDLMAATLSEDERDSLRVVFARYLGETVRLAHGGKWALPLDDHKDIHFNRPVIIGHSRYPLCEFSPIHAIRAYSLRRRPGLIRNIVASSVDPRILDLSDLAEED
ncbi:MULTISPECIES: hypothetical protein [Stenotrophomonas]|uniref:hypothetical protein n=1 Tax=Stenotrophomonas TaxID=40323 RepID=UPI0015DF1414|nr:MULTISPECIES: hypothetical protein [Stenotrophomonas maltophilia group]MBA0398312.1 hypothetical protein [Stenotrophomonas maltophilia]QNA95812.1 hypothetical protein G4G30_09995 [Stenotrophomonas maltophilia]